MAQGQDLCTAGSRGLPAQLRFPFSVSVLLRMMGTAMGAGSAERVSVWEAN